MNNINQFKRCSAYLSRRFFSSTSANCSESPIIIKKLNKVMTIGINRPETCNAINYETANRLSDAVSQFEEDDSVSVGIIHGIAGNFCSGFDLKEMNNDPNLAEKLTGLLKELPTCVLSIYSSRNYPHVYFQFTAQGITHMCTFNLQRLTDRYVSKPLVAAVSGYAVGVGMDLALWCDIRVMEDTAVMGCFQRRFGIPQSQAAMDRLKHMVGLSRSLDWVLTGRAIKAEEAFNCGLIGRLVACGTALGQAYSVATAIGKFSPAALNTDRAALYLTCLSEKHIQAGLIATHRENHLHNCIKEAEEGAKKFTEGCGRHGKSTGLFAIENDIEIDEQIRL